MYSSLYDDGEVEIDTKTAFIVDRDEKVEPKKPEIELPAFLKAPVRPEPVPKMKPQDLLKEHLAVRNARERHGSKDDENKVKKVSALTSVYDLSNQKDRIKVDKISYIKDKNGNTYEEYDPRRPNDYGSIKSKIQNFRNPAKFIENAKNLPKSAIEWLNKKDNTEKKPNLPAKRKFAVPYTGGSSSDEEPIKTGRGGGAQIAPPTFLTENNNAKNGPNALYPAKKTGLRNFVPLFKRAQALGMDSKRPETVGETTIVLLKNVVGPGRVDADLKSEIVEECSRYGRVLDSKIIDQSTLGVKTEVHEAVRVFLKFSQIDNSKKAVAELNGRQLGGRKLSAEFYSVIRFDTNDLLEK